MGRSYIGDIPNPSLRDFQRKRLYKAEGSCNFWKDLKVLSMSKVKDLVKEIGLWADITPPTIVHTTRKNARYLAYATASEIVLPFPLSKSIPFICHEMSHVINYQRGPADHHGPNFATAYLEVVRQFIGHTEYGELKESFKSFKVKSKEVIPI